MQMAFWECVPNREVELAQNYALNSEQCLITSFYGNNINFSAICAKTSNVQIYFKATPI
jgi:hypothetical protein